MRAIMYLCCNLFGARSVHAGKIYLHVLYRYIYRIYGTIIRGTYITFVTYYIILQPRVYYHTTKTIRFYSGRETTSVRKEKPASVTRFGRFLRMRAIISKFYSRYVTQKEKKRRNFGGKIRIRVYELCSQNFVLFDFLKYLHKMLRVVKEAAFFSLNTPIKIELQTI